MGLFKPEVNSYLGVDLSSDAIKIVELKPSEGKPQLVTYGYTEAKSSTLRGDFIENKNITSTLLKEICNKSKTLSTRALAALPVASVFVSIVKIPILEKKDLSNKPKLKELIREQVKGILPMPIDEMFFDFNLMNQKDVEGSAEETLKGVKFLITASSKQIVKTYAEIFNQAGLELINLDIEPFALVRSLIGNDQSLIMLVDFGENSTSLTMVDKGIPVLNRALNIGGSAITKSISEHMNFTAEEAEQYKYDLSILVQQEGLQGLPEPVQMGITPIVAEMKYVIKTYYEQHGQEKKVDKVVLTGGSASLANLNSYLTTELGVNTYVGDPWARIIYPQELTPVLKEIGTRFSVAVGLAMRDII